MSWTYDYQMPAATSDIILVNPNYEILLLKRAGETGKGMWALPGGYVDPDESPLEAAHRELREETSLVFIPLKLFDVRKNLYKTESWRIKSIYYAMLDENKAVHLNHKEHTFHEWRPMLKCQNLFSDHEQIISDFILTHLVK